MKTTGIVFWSAVAGVGLSLVMTVVVVLTTKPEVKPDYQPGKVAVPSFEETTK